MTTRTSAWPPGVPCWTDLSVPDVEAASRFYAAVLGWDCVPTGEEFGGYVIAQVDGHAVAGIGPQQAPDVPAAWTLYLATADADATLSAVAQAGGVLLLPAGDVGPLGRMGIAADPTGAVFGVWQAGEHIGAGLVNEPGGLTWEDLRSSDPGAARDFYGAVFGYAYDAVEMAPDDYRTFAAAPGEPPLGGMGGFMGGPPMPSHWLVYFGAADVSAAVDAAGSSGGSVLAPAFDTPYGRMAGLSDPFGAVFFVVETTAPAPPGGGG